MPGADQGGPVEDGAHPVVGRERLTVDDTDGRELAGPFRVERLGRLLLDELVELLEEGEVVGVHGVEDRARPG